jgi:SAM-dependent methyltransferase
MLADRGAKVTGIDISPGVIEVAKQARPEHCSPPMFVVGDAQNTGFADQHFDLVLGTGILHHLNLDLAYAEIARILKAGGMALFMEPQAGSLFLRAFRKVTPRARSVDERPLYPEDITLASRYFSKIRTHEYFLLSVAAAPLHLASERLAGYAARAIDRLDQTVFARSASARRSAWYTRLEMTR